MPNSHPLIQVHLLNIIHVLLHLQDSIHRDNVDHRRLTKDILPNKEVHPTKIQGVSRGLINQVTRYMLIEGIVNIEVVVEVAVVLVILQRG